MERNIDPDLSAAFSVLNIKYIPSSEEIDRIYKELALRYQSRSLNPITPADSLAKVKLEQLRLAYNIIKSHMSRDRSQNTPPVSLQKEVTLRIDLQAYLYHISKSSIEINVEKVSKCFCMKTCAECEGRGVSSCKRCRGKGWYSFCSECRGQGQTLGLQTLKFKLEPLLKDRYSWTHGETRYTLIVQPYKGYYIRDGELWLEHVIDLEQLVSNKFCLSALTLQISPFFKKTTCISNISNFSDILTIPLDSSEIVDVLLPLINKIRLKLVPLKMR